MNLIFRVALAGYVLSMLVVVLAVFVLGFGELPLAASAYLDWWNREPQSRTEFLAVRINLVALVLSSLAVIGMAFFKTWARLLFAVCVVGLIVTEGLLDYPIFKTPLEYQMDSLATLLAGAIIAMAYWSPIAYEFGGKQS